MENDRWPIDMDKTLDDLVTRGQHLWISQLLFDAVDCTVTITLTPDPDKVQFDRAVKFVEVGNFQCQRCTDPDEVCYGVFMGFHRASVGVDGKRSRFLLNTGDAEVAFAARDDPTVGFG